MTQSPTPGPLSAEDWLTIDTAPKDGSHFESQDRDHYGDRVFEGTHWYVHPSVTGWNTDDLDCGDYEFEPTHWRPSRLAPTAPVEASGSERDTSDAIDLLVRSKVALQGHIDAIQIAKRDGGASVQPITECVNGLPEIVRWLDAGQFEIEAAFEDYENSLKAALRPLALGGQHSGGEGCRGCGHVGSAPKDRIACCPDGKRYDTTPARAEALDEGAAGEAKERLREQVVRWADAMRRVPGTSINSPSRMEPDHLLRRVAADILTVLDHPSPPPADEDRVREVLEEAHSYLEVLHSITANATTRSSVWKVIKRVREALKSTAAKEGEKS
nr:hypothetical protein [uncultured Brevundimonas sp.]